MAELKVRPGIVRDDTEISAGDMGYYRDGNRVRFRLDKPETIGGWQKIISESVTGRVRGLHQWAGSDGSRYIAVGTSSKLYVLYGGTLYDITPIRDSGTLGTDPLTTTDGSATVRVDHTSHGMLDGATAILSGASAVNNIPAGELNATHVITRIDDDTYTITVTTLANASGSGGGSSIDYQYELNPGPEDGSTGYGYGTGTYGRSTWGTPRDPSSVAGVALDPRIWALDNFGEDLVAAPINGTLYRWDTSAGTSNRAAAIANAPDQIPGGIIVSSEDRHLIAFGVDSAGNLAPLMVGWADQEDLTTWTPAADNTAGAAVMSGASRLKGGIRTTGEIVLFAETALYAMRFSGPPYTFGINLIDAAAGVISVKSAAALNGRVYWMGQDAFYVYDGSLDVLPCPVRDHVFKNLTAGQQGKVIAATVKGYSEIWWFYPHGTTENSRYVSFNAKDGTWAIGELDRTAFVDQGVFPNPIGADPDGFLYFHESGDEADGEVMNWFVETGAVDMQDGEKIGFLSRFICDFESQTADVQVVFKARQYPSHPFREKGPFTISLTTDHVKPRVRGREIAIRFQDAGVVTAWRNGKMRLEVNPDGGQ